ncbi:glutamate--cysteine ligase [Oceanitalea stevensii]|uniref:Glutamate--cysteine ligase n=1 Tax=Oceanitalea stevensii TaxID=2763072 RepID=A0ABR8Z676_9MICO|nr:glutamate--cysteine ligase [Oceanitalea stevensii]MBD8063436.1 glutamate--cysteine ligase [Oceanitalea stevensii]
MGEDISGTTFTRADHARYRAKIRRCLDTLEAMLDAGVFVEDEWRTGLEIELGLAGPDMRPFHRNAEVLERIADPLYQTELGTFTIELNVEPRRIDGQSLEQLEAALRRNLNRARDRAGDVGAELVMVGILPTLPAPPAGRSWFTASDRYVALDEAVMNSRREDITLRISGPEPLSLTMDSIIAEAACTSTQLHLQVTPRRYADYWNASQLLAGPQLVMGANSPFLFGHHLQAETRVETFLQATDTRSVELRNQGVRPRVFFGDRWITSIFDLFEENVRYFPALLPVSSDEDPAAVLAAGGTPSLAELRLHNGTVYRWNRPIYDVQDGRPHLRVENRVLPAGPSVVDTLANAAFFYGMVVELVTDERPLWSRMSFDAARDNFHAAARYGIDARLYWPGLGEVSGTELVLDTLLPMAARGLERLGVEASAAGKYLDIIEARARLRRNGATWQVAAVEAYEERGKDRRDALHLMLADYVRHMHGAGPVHTWEVPT